MEVRFMKELHVEEDPGESCWIQEIKNRILKLDTTRSCEKLAVNQWWIPLYRRPWYVGICNFEMRPSKVAYVFLCYNPIKYPVKTYVSGYHITISSKFISDVSYSKFQ